MTLKMSIKMKEKAIKKAGIKPAINYAIVNISKPTNS